MPQKYKRKARPHEVGRERGNYNSEQLQEAVNAVRAGKMSVRAAARAYNIPKSTISDHKVGHCQPGDKRGRATILPAAVEESIVSKTIQAAEMGFGVTKRQIRVKAFRIAEAMKIEHPFKNGRAGERWWLGLKGRHPELKLRKPQALSTSRSRLMDKDIVTKYFKDLENVVSTNNLTADMIWNMDEKGIQFQHSPARIVASRMSSVPGRVSNSRESVTCVAGGNAVGTTLPPLLVVRGKTRASLYNWRTEQGPPTAVWTYQARAWMTEMLGEEWFKTVFIPNIGPKRPQLLVLDSHGSHEVLELVENAAAENIILLALPPHCTHHLQPCDNGIFSVFEREWDIECTEYMSANPNHDINKQSFPKLFSTVWKKATTSANWKASFKCTGLWPVSQAAILDRAYKAAAPFQLNNDIDVQMIEGVVDEQGQGEENEASNNTADISSEVDYVLPFIYDQDSGTISVSDPNASEDMVKSWTDVLKQAGIYVSSVTPFDNVPTTAASMPSPGPSTSTMSMPSPIPGPSTTTVSASPSLPMSNSTPVPSSLVSPCSPIDAVHKEFYIPPVEPKTPGSSNKRRLNSHRILTSPEILNEKRQKREEKERLEKEKEERKIMKEKKRKIKEENELLKKEKSKCQAKENDRPTCDNESDHDVSEDDSDSEVEDEDADCILCQNSDFRDRSHKEAYFWIACDTCDTWYHVFCARKAGCYLPRWGKVKKQATKFICHKCD